MLFSSPLCCPGLLLTTSTTAAPVTSVVSDSVRPHRRQPPRLPCPWDSPGKNTGVGCHFLLQYMKVKSEREVAQSCPTLSDPMDCSLPGSSVHGICQARVLEWGAIAFSVFLATLPLLSMAQSTYFLSICISSLGAFGNQSPQTEGRSRRLNS